jgi:hypothetical protein
VGNFDFIQMNKECKMHVVSKIAIELNTEKARIEVEEICVVIAKS